MVRSKAMHALRLNAVCAFIALWLVTPWPAAACSCMLDRSPARLKTLFERPMLLTAHASATGNLWTTMCDRNMPMELAGPELAVLGPGQRVSVWWVSAPALIGEAVLAGLVALGGLSFWLNRRDTRKATHNTGA